MSARICLATIAIVHPPNQTMIALSDVECQQINQSKYQIKAEMHIFPNILPSFKLQLLHFFPGHPLYYRNNYNASNKYIAEIIIIMYWGGCLFCFEHARQGKLRVDHTEAPASMHYGKGFTLMLN
jgi:hypothetical protein